MNYSLISDYIESIKSAEDNFNELGYLRPVLGDDGLPVMTSGNLAVVLKMKDVKTGKSSSRRYSTSSLKIRSESARNVLRRKKQMLLYKSFRTRRVAMWHWRARNCVSDIRQGRTNNR